MLVMLSIAIVSYLFGSFPTGLIVGKLFFGFDIREHGSGNIGSTNVFRTLGTKWGIVVQIVDILKGFIPVFFIAPILSRNIEPILLLQLGGKTGIQIIAGFCAIAGHIWSIFLKFKGGKGINTTLGVLLGIIPFEVSIAILVFILCFLATGIVSVGSIVASATLPIIILIRRFAFQYYYPNFQLLLILILLLVFIIIYTHRNNIKRILNGTENRFEKFHIIKFKKR